MSQQFNAPGSRVKAKRIARDWSQLELAERAGISRTAISAIEGNRLVPSVAAALQLAAALDCTVEDLFGATRGESLAAWATLPQRFPCRYWAAEVFGRRLLYPVEHSPAGTIAHDGVAHSVQVEGVNLALAEQTLVMSSCDPAASLLVEAYARSSGKRLLVLPRASRRGLQMLEEGLVHLAGVHLCGADDAGGNAAMIRAMNLKLAQRILHVAHWQEGIVLQASAGLRSVRAAKSANLRWVGREAGSGARHCLDELLGDRPEPRRLASDHRGVAEAVRNDWADAGICVRLACEDAGLSFLSLRNEPYDLCYAQALDGDHRLTSLLQTIRSTAYRKLLGELPGYDATPAGAVEAIQ